MPRKFCSRRTAHDNPTAEAPWITAARLQTKSGDGVISRFKAYLRAAMGASKEAELICRYNTAPHVDHVDGYQIGFTRRAPACDSR